MLRHVSLSHCHQPVSAQKVGLRCLKCHDQGILMRCRSQNFAIDTNSGIDLGVAVYAACLFRLWLFVAPSTFGWPFRCQLGPFPFRPGRFGLVFGG